MPRQSNEIGAYEARTHLAQLLRRVAAGGRFTITQRGRAVAELVPVDSTRRDKATRAAGRMKEFIHKYPPVENVDLRALIDEGRD